MAVHNYNRYAPAASKSRRQFRDNVQFPLSVDKPNKIPLNWESSLNIEKSFKRKIRSAYEYFMKGYRLATSNGFLRSRWWEAPLERITFWKQQLSDYTSHLIRDLTGFQRDTYFWFAINKEVLSHRERFLPLSGRPQRLTVRDLVITRPIDQLPVHLTVRLVISSSDFERN